MNPHEIVQLTQLINVLSGAMLVLLSALVWRRYPLPFFGSWLGGFAMFLVIVSVELTCGLVPRSIALSTIQNAAAAIATWCFLLTIRRLTGRPAPGLAAIAVVTACFAASTAMTMGGVIYRLAALPLLTSASFTMGWMGWTIMRKLPEEARAPGAAWVGGAAVAQGLWPFVFPYALVAGTPWSAVGYIGSGLLKFVIGVGMILYVLDLSWGRFQKAQSQLTAMKNDFVSVVSHELRSPLTAAIGYAEFLEEEVAGPLNEAQREYVGEIQKGHRRLRRLVDDLLDFSLAEGRTLKLNIRGGELNALMRSAVESHRLLAKQASVTLTMAPSEAPVPIQLDVDRLEQVVANLVGNALKFTQAGGEVRVSVRRDAAEAWIAIHDSGMGIEPADLPLLFDKFFQAHTGPQRARGGAGLGLAVAKAIVEAHGGRISVDSEVGRGTCFTIRLPLEEPVSGDGSEERMTS